MKRLSIVLLSGFVMLLASGTGFAQHECPYSEAGYTSLFNGKDLSGWKVPDGDNGHWSVIEGVIDYDARSEAETDKNLWTEGEFEDFKLHVEWRFKGYGAFLFPLPTILPDGSLVKDENGEVVQIYGAGQLVRVSSGVSGTTRIFLPKCAQLRFPARMPINRLDSGMHLISW